jgi:hypothetical protein
MGRRYALLDKLPDRLEKKIPIGGHDHYRELSLLRMAGDS